MNFARPATGFIMAEPASFKELLQSQAEKWPRVTSHWEGIKDRLKMTAHREGASIGGNPSNRVFEAEGDIASELPTIRVAYHVLGDNWILRCLLCSIRPVSRLRHYNNTKGCAF
jgi:hypothetical protein